MSIVILGLVAALLGILVALVGRQPSERIQSSVEVPLERLELSHILVRWINEKELWSDPLAAYFVRDGERVYFALERVPDAGKRQSIRRAVRWFFPLLPAAVQWEILRAYVGLEHRL